MEIIDFIVKKDLQPFVNCVMVREESNPSGITNIPLHADGYPGIMFQQSKNGFYFLPKRKKLSTIFLYGQTLRPAALSVEGPFSCIVFQLYPFASKYLLGVNPRELQDDCFDLLQLSHVNVRKACSNLGQSENLEHQIETISELMLKLVQHNKIRMDDRIQQAVHSILANKGAVVINQLIEDLHVTERTFERNFLSEVGLTPKQFAKIVRFQYALHKLTTEKFEKLTEIGLDSGFADQSHFNREFKRYTGQTPSYYLEQINQR
jgi:AraC-like DNA-binding protein